MFLSISKCKNPHLCFAMEKNLQMFVVCAPYRIANHIKFYVQCACIPDFFHVAKV